MSAANIREIYESFDTVYWPEQITLVGNQTVDLSELRSKTSEMLVSGKPTLITDASTALIVGGQPSGGNGDFTGRTHAPRFHGEFWLYNSGTRAHGTRGVFVNAETYRLHCDQLWIQNFGGGLQGTLGEIKMLTIPHFYAWDFVAFGLEFFSRDHLKEISEIFINGNVEGNTSESAAEGIYFSLGPGIGSAGKIGAHFQNGVCYRQKSVGKHWATREIVSRSWALEGGTGVATYVLEDYHSVAPGDNVWNGGCDNAAYNNLTATPDIALAGTDGKTIKIAMASDPGSYVTPGYFTYNYRIVPAAMNDFERPRKITYTNISGRGQRGKVFDTRSGGKMQWDKCIADDGGVSEPYALYCTASWAAGVVTYSTWEEDGTTPKEHELSPGDFFNTRYFDPGGYDASLEALTVPTPYTVTAAMADDPGAFKVRGRFYKPITLTADGWYFGPYAGSYIIKDSEAHENYRSAVYDDRVTNERSIITGNRFFNSTYGLPDPPNPVADLYFRPGRANMTVTDNILGAGDTWRFSSKSFLFSANPADGDYVALKVSSTAEPTYFIFTTTSDTDASQPSVLIGATVADTIASLRDAIHTRDDDNCNAVQAIPTNASLDPNAATVDRLMIVRTVPGAIGRDFTLEESSSSITLSPSGSSLAGGTGGATANYGIMNIRDGERGNVVQRNQAESHTDGASNMTDLATAPVVRANLLDNSDFSLDQPNEGAAVTITGPTTVTRLLDRWLATRGTSNITAQRVTGERGPYALRLTGAASNTSAIVYQRHGSDWGALRANKICTLSVYVKTDIATAARKRAFLQVSYADAANNFTTTTQIKLKPFVIGATLTRISVTFLMPANAANGVQIALRHVAGLLAGETLTYEQAKLEEGGTITDYVSDLPEDNLFSCQRHYRKSFPSGTAPAQNAGITGAIVGVQSLAGAVAQQFQTVEFNPPMRAAPTVTLYNPSATNAQIRNTVAAADWTVSSAGTPAATGITLTGTGPGGGAAGEASAVHYTAEADFL